MSPTEKKPTVFMMDLLATVPYYTAYLSRALLAEGVPLTVGSITYYLDPDCFRGRGIKLQPGLLDVVGRFRLPRLPRRLLKFAETVLNMAALALRFLVQPPDILHVQYLPMLRSRLPLDWWLVRFCRSRGARVMLTVHDLLPHDTAELHKRVFQNLYRSVDGIICHSDHVKLRLEREFGIPVQKVRVIPHGPFFFDLPEAAGQAPPLPELAARPVRRVVLWQGIIFPYKGLDLLVNAWQQVEREVPDATLVVVGTGAPDLLAGIRDQVHRLGLKRVELIFRFISTEELVASYRAADIVVYPYRAITTSGALATGLSLGKAIVASDLPVFRELLVNEENAILVDPKLPGHLAGAILDLLRDSDKRARLISAVKNMHFGNQSWQTIATETTAAYNSLLL